MPFPQRVRLLFGSLSPSKFGDKISSVADLGCLSRILNPESECFPSRIQDTGSKFFPSWIPDPRFDFFPSQVLDPGCISKNLSIWIWILTFYLYQILILDTRSRIQGSKRQRIPDTGSRIRIRNTGDFGFAQAVGGSIGYWLSTGSSVLGTHSMDQLSEAFMCKKKFSVYFIFTLSL